MPTPRSNEDKKNFISRCIPYVKKEHPEWKTDKCVAVCHSIWRKKHPGTKSIDKSSDVQALIFKKPKFNRSSAKAWAKSHGFKTYTDRETDNTIRLRQFDPSLCTKSGGMKELDDGVQGYICPVANKTKKSIDELLAELNEIKAKLPHTSGHYTPHIPAENIEVE